jgi:cytochrome c oxidase cbb3-type subunit 3/ubiquinol-cytochrome c reductase cytochrome c subunit
MTLCRSTYLYVYALQFGGLLSAAAPLAGCNGAPGKPGPELAITRPDQVTDFNQLYAQNCQSCHGVNGKNGVAISLANPVYIALAGTQNIQRITAAGVPNTSMPGFSKSAGGMLSDQQIAALAQGIVQRWGNQESLRGQIPPPYTTAVSGNAASGQKVFTTYCAQCHGADGNGAKLPNGTIVGSLVDPSYLALISDQDLRSLVISGQPEQGMPDWRSQHAGNIPHTLTDQEVTDIVAWLTSHRSPTPGSPYAGRP